MKTLGIDERIILKWIFKTWDKAEIGMTWFRIATGNGLM